MPDQPITPTIDIKTAIERLKRLEHLLRECGEILPQHFPEASETLAEDVTAADALATLLEYVERLPTLADGEKAIRGYALISDAYSTQAAAEKAKVKIDV
jgi:hypothetical protein